MDVVVENKITLRLFDKDIKQMIYDYYKKHNNVEIDLDSIKWEIKEKVIGQFWINNLESEDEWGFDYLSANIKILE